MADFMESMMDQEGPKKKAPAVLSVEEIERKIEAIKAERKRRLNPPVNLPSGKQVYDKAALEDLNKREAALRSQLSKARGDERRALAKP